MVFIFTSQSRLAVHEENWNQRISEGSKSALRIRSGDLGKSGPAARAKADARRNAVNNRSPKSAKSKSGGSSFAEAWSSNHSNRSRPAAANRLAQQFQTGPAEGGNGLFGRFSARPTPDPYNTGCAGGPKSITVLSGQRNSDLSPNYSETVKFNDGYKAEVVNVQLDHILVKHGHQWGIDDIDFKNTRDANNNLSPFKPEQRRTRLTPENREKLRTGIQEMASSCKLESYPNYPISGDMGRAYLCPDTGLFLGIDKNNVIRKAYVASENLINYLRTNCI